MKTNIEDLSENELVGTKFAAEYLKCSMQTVRNWIAAGKIPITEITLGGHNRIRFKDLKMVKDKMQKSAKKKGR